MEKEKEGFKKKKKENDKKKKEEREEANACCGQSCIYISLYYVVWYSGLI